MDHVPRQTHDNDDADWLALLGGASVPEARPETIREAQAMRQAIPADTSVPRAATDEQAGLERLLGRLEREGLLTPAPRRWRLPTIWTAVATAALVLCALPWVLTQVTQGPESVLKSEQHLLQVLHVADPAAQAQALQRALGALGMAVERRDIGDSQHLKATLPREVPAPVLQVLTQYTLVAPADGVLLVEFLPSMP